MASLAKSCFRVHHLYQYMKFTRQAGTKQEAVFAADLVDGASPSVASTKMDSCKTDGAGRWKGSGVAACVDRVEILSALWP